MSAWAPYLVGSLLVLIGMVGGSFSFLIISAALDARRARKIERGILNATKDRLEGR